jgi:hypothetical protein
MESRRSGISGFLAALDRKNAFTRIGLPAKDYCAGKLFIAGIL